jgi:hypothetical protein
MEPVREPDAGYARVRIQAGSVCPLELPYAVQPRWCVISLSCSLLDYANIPPE